MKLKISLVSLLLTFVAVTFAQELKTYTTETAGYKNAFKYNSFKDNWFIQLGAGAQMLIAEDLKESFFVPEQLTLAPTFAVGKWFIPWAGVRFKVEGGSLHSFDEWTRVNGKSEIDYSIMQKDHYYAGHFDLMWNVSNSYGKYNSKRVFSFIPYAGLGVYYREKSDQELLSTKGSSKTYTVTSKGRLAQHNNETGGLTAHMGLLFQFRLSNRIGFHVDLAGMLTDDHLNRILWDDNKWHSRYDGVASATAGFTFNFAKTYFEPIEAMDYDLINDLNKKINDLRAENEELSKRPIKEIVEVEPAVTVVEKYNFLSNVFFRLNKYVIDANQQINVYNSAQFVKNTGQKIKVVGYADKKTGNPKINIWLGEQRAKAVAKELMTKYGIPSDMLIVEWKGDTEQPFAINNWNRVVIMTAAQ